MNGASSSIPVCSGRSYPEMTCFCYMDQCLEAVRYRHMEKCGNSTAPDPPPPPEVEEIEDSNATSSNQTDYNIQRHLALMFEWVRFSSLNAD